MVALRPSSPFKPFGPFPQPVAPDLESVYGVDLPEPFIDDGLPIPETYEIDIVRALLQDPFRIFIYWEVREESLKALTHYFAPEDLATFRTTLKLFDVGGQVTAYFDVNRRGQYWMAVFPNREYEFEIGVYSPLHGYIAVVRSNRVRTPLGTVSPVVAEESGFETTPAQFLEIMDASGFGATETLDFTIEGMPGLPGAIDSLEQLMNRMPASVREAILMAARGGVLTSGMIDHLPEPLRATLRDLAIDGDPRLATAALMHYFPELLRETFDDENELIAGPAHPVRFAPRIFASGSENVTRPSEAIHLPRRPSSAELIRP